SAVTTASSPATKGRRARNAVSAKTVSGVEKDRAVRYGSMSGRPVLAAGMVMAAVTAKTAAHRALSPEKQHTASIQQATSKVKSVATYQKNAVASVDKRVSRAVHARMCAKSDRLAWV